MTPEAFRAALSRLNLTQPQAGKLLGKGERTIRRYCVEGAPLTVEQALKTIKAPSGKRTKL